MFLEDIQGDDFKVNLVDVETKEVIHLNTIDANASAIPLLGLRVSSGLKWAIKKYGKKALINTFGRMAIDAALDYVADYVVKNKHLSNTTATGTAKFNTSSRWMKETLKSASISNLTLNDGDSKSQTD